MYFLIYCIWLHLQVVQILDTQKLIFECLLAIKMRDKGGHLPNCLSKILTERSLLCVIFFLFHVCKVKTFFFHKLSKIDFNSTLND